MARKFGSAAAFKTSLEAHLRKRAEERKIPLSTLQLKFVMERLLARLFRNPDPPWLQAVIWKGREGQSWAEKSLKKWPNSCRISKAWKAARCERNVFFAIFSLHSP